VYVDDVKVGGMYVINGQARMVARTLADPEGGARTYISLEGDPDVSGIEAMRFYVQVGGVWYEHMRITYGGSTSTTIKRFPTDTSLGGLQVIADAGAGTETSLISVLGGSAGQARLYASGASNTYELIVSASTGVSIKKNNTTLESWT
jgi:hypothetical protein